MTTAMMARKTRHRPNEVGANEPPGPRRTNGTGRSAKTRIPHSTQPPEGGAPNDPLRGWATPGLHDFKRMRLPMGAPCGLHSAFADQSAAVLAATIRFGADKSASTHPLKGVPPMTR